MDPLRGHLGPSWGNLGIILALLGSSRRALGAISGQAWALFAPPWAHLGKIWDHLGPPWDHLGPSWPHYGPSSAVLKLFGGPFGAFSGSFRGRLGTVWELSSAPSAASEHAVIILALFPTITKTTPGLKTSNPHTLVGRGGDAKRLQLTNSSSLHPNYYTAKDYHGAHGLPSTARTSHRVHYK